MYRKHIEIALKLDSNVILIYSAHLPPNRILFLTKYLYNWTPAINYLIFIAEMLSSQKV